MPSKTPEDFAEVLIRLEASAQIGYRDLAITLAMITDRLRSTSHLLGALLVAEPGATLNRQALYQPVEDELATLTNALEGLVESLRRRAPEALS